MSIALPRTPWIGEPFAGATPTGESPSRFTAPTTPRGACRPQPVSATPRTDDVEADDVEADDIARQFDDIMRRMDDLTRRTEAAFAALAERAAALTAHFEARRDRILADVDPNRASRPHRTHRSTAATPGHHAAPATARPPGAPRTSTTRSARE